MLFIRTISLAILLGLGSNMPVQAQPAKAPAKAPGATDSASKPTSKEQIMASPQWERARQAFEDWLDIQQMYNEQ
ncbi:MAG: hypothetical protein N2C12_12540, partial [Planctomycetales bacterium]